MRSAEGKRSSPCIVATPSHPSRRAVPAPPSAGASLASPADPGPSREGGGDAQTQRHDSARTALLLARCCVEAVRVRVPGDAFKVEPRKMEVDERNLVMHAHILTKDASLRPIFKSEKKCGEEPNCWWLCDAALKENAQYVSLSSRVEPKNSDECVNLIGSKANL